jgi:3-hydroxyisobutyrate dehydrogenase-like beta-hydroxyacid dehydrogenase
MPRVHDGVGFVGTGRLGEPMVQRLLAAGYPVTAVARQQDAADRLRASGAHITRSVADVARSSRIVISCLFSDDQVRQALAGPDGLLANMQLDSLFVSHTTGTPDTLARIMAETRGGSKVTVLDAPVSGTAADVAAGCLTVMIGGDAQAVDQVTPALSAYCGNIIHTGSFGTALTAKLVNNLVFAANNQIVGAASAIAAQMGLEPGLLLRVLSVSSGSSHAVTYALRSGGVAAVENLVAEFLVKDTAACRAVADATGTDLGWLGRVVDSGPLELGRR